MAVLRLRVAALRVNPCYHSPQHQEQTETGGDIMAEKPPILAPLPASAEKLDEALKKIEQLAGTVQQLASNVGTVQKQLARDDMDLNGDGMVSTSERFWFRILKATQNNGLWTIFAVISFVVITYFFA